MLHIERKAELCPEPAALQPCGHCGSSAAIIEVFANQPMRISRICCGGDPWWHSQAGRAWFAVHGIDVAAAAQACRHLGGSRAHG